MKSKTIRREGVRWRGAKKVTRLAASPLDFALAATPRALNCAPTWACSQAILCITISVRKGNKCWKCQRKISLLKVSSFFNMPPYLWLLKLHNPGWELYNFKTRLIIKSASLATVQLHVVLLPALWMLGTGYPLQEAVWWNVLWQWIWNLDVPGSNPPICCYLDLFLVALSSTPPPTCVNSQPASPPPVGICFNYLVSPINTTTLNKLDT